MLSIGRVVAFKPLPMRVVTRCLLSTNIGPVAAPTDLPILTATKKIKHRIPRKRASKLRNELENEEFLKAKEGRIWPDFRAGDAIAIDRLPYATATQVETFKGVVLAKTNKKNMSQVLMCNVEEDTPIQRRICIYDPLVKDIRIIQKWFIHKGLKPVRRSKIYYLWDRHPDSFTVV